MKHWSWRKCCYRERKERKSKGACFCVMWREKEKEGELVCEVREREEGGVNALHC